MFIITKGWGPWLEPALCSALCVRVSSPSAAAAGSCCNSSVSTQCDWGRFLYSSKSLCEHRAIMDTQTVINSSILPLDTRDGESVASPRSTAAEPSWGPWIEGDCFVYQQFGSFSRFLDVPAEVIPNIWAPRGTDGHSPLQTDSLGFVRLCQKFAGRRLCNKKWRMSLLNRLKTVFSVTLA